MADPTDSTKRCPRCSADKPLGEFGANKKARDGKNWVCKACTNAAAATWRATHLERSKATDARWKAANRDKINANRRAFTAKYSDRIKSQIAALRAADPEKYAARLASYDLKYKIANPDKVKLTQRKNKQKNKDKNYLVRSKYRQANSDRIYNTSVKWRKANPLISAAQNHKRRAMKRDAPGSWTGADIADIRRMQKDMCANPLCRKKLKMKGTIDHIIALVRGGSNDRRNLQLLCKSCNSSKGTADQIVFMQSRGLLL
jgi:5-methylcytosine-specific restriction endonuclease McrA